MSPRPGRRCSAEDLDWSDWPVAQPRATPIALSRALIGRTCSCLGTGHRARNSPKGPERLAERRAQLSPRACMQQFSTSMPRDTSSVPFPLC